MVSKLFHSVVLSIAMSSVMVATSAEAASAASGSGFGLQTNLSAVPLVGAPTTLTLGPAPSGVSGTAPPDFNQTGTQVSITGNLLGGAVTVASGTLNAATQSTLLSNTVSSSASVQNLNIALIIQGVQATTVSSTASATCSANAVVLSGSSNLVGATATGVASGPITATPAPNTVLVDSLGVKIILNEQLVSGNQITVNAIHIILTNAVLTGQGVLAGDIVVAQSKASLADCALPNLAMSLTGPATATVGAPFAYVLTLANTGTVATGGTITVTDAIPAGLTINSITNGSGFACSAVAQLVTCTTSGVIAAGASNIPVATVTVTATAAGQPSNTATVSGGGDNTPVNNTSPPVVTNITVAAAPDLAMSKSGPASATMGVPYNYVLTLANVGAAASTGTVTVTDTLGAGITINSVTGGASFSCGTVGQTVTCTSSAVFAAGASSVPVATINVTSTVTGQISNTAVVAGGGDGSPVNNTTPAVLTNVTAAAATDLTVNLSGPASATVGTPFNYALTLANVGGAASSGTVTVTDTLPAGVTINSATGNGTFVCSIAGQTVTCTSSAVVGANTANVPVATINVTPTAPGLISDNAAISGGGDATPANNTSPTVITNVTAVAAPDLVMTKNAPVSATVGVAFNYVLTLSNAGGGATTGIITVSDPIPAGLTINSVTNGGTFTCSATGQLVTCTSSAAIASGASNVAVATVSVTPTGNGQYSNVATAAGGGDSTPVNNSNPPLNTIAVVGTPDLAMSKSGPTTALANAAFNYVLSLANTGTAPTVGTVTVADSVPVGLTINSVANGAGFACGVAGQTVTCSSASAIPIGGALVVATINVTATRSGQFSNTASVSGGGDVTPGNNTSLAVVTSVATVPTGPASPIPALSPLLLMVVGLLVALMGVVTVRRRQFR